MTALRKLPYLMVFDERFGDRSEGRAYDDGDSEVDDVAAQDEVAKAFDHVASLGEG
jgi:hypothetical protein